MATAQERSDSSVIDNNSIFRTYTVTIKPVYTPFKGNLAILSNVLTQLCNRISALSCQMVYEDKNSNNVHCHALIECPLITSKKAIAQSFFGYHIHMNIIRFKSQEDIKSYWLQYTQKEMTSDSEKFYHKFGNGFL